MVYEAVLLFGIFFVADLLFELVTQDFNQPALRHWRQVYLFAVIGLYFTYFWSHSGQTLAMQTWRIKVVSTDLQAPTFKQACVRYCIAWMWFLPALGANYFFNLKEWPSVIALCIGMMAWALTSKLDKNGQFLHDKLAGTQLITIPKNSTS